SPIVTLPLHDALPISVWTAFSAGAALAQWLLHEAAMLSTPMAAVSGTRVGAAILIAAGIYQLTPWKRQCLKHCRSPLGFLMTDRSEEHTSELQSRVDL